jgi:hypothetical protein
LGVKGGAGRGGQTAKKGGDHTHDGTPKRAGDKAANKYGKMNGGKLLSDIGNGRYEKGKNLCQSKADGSVNKAAKFKGFSSGQEQILSFLVVSQ